MHFQPMGDQALLAYCDDEPTAFALAAAVRQQQLPWVFDVVQAYKSVAVFVDLDRVDFADAAGQLSDFEHSSPPTNLADTGRLHVVPCCYALGLDLQRVAESKCLAVEEAIRLHANQAYTVYAIGFCPGFPYLGYLPEALRNVPRLPSPRQRVEAGSVGLTGKQTGIYTLDRPGGWSIVGRTPLQLVDVAGGYFPLRTGDRVQFRPIDEEEFRALAGKRL